MQLILLSKNRGHVGQMQLTSARAWASIFGLAFLVCAGAFYGGFWSAGVFGVANPQAQADAWKADLAQQQTLVDTTRRALQQNLDALALRLGQMNAHVVRLDALGSRLTQMAGLKDGEFDFTSAPSLGGPEEPLLETDSDFMQISGVISALDVLDEQLADRGRQLSRARGLSAESQAARRSASRRPSRHVRLYLLAIRQPHGSVHGPPRVP